jgi:hypothetical protein
VDADAKLNAALRRQASIALDHPVLHINSAAHGIDNASELDENAVSSPLNDAAVMRRDGGIEQIAPQPAQPRKRPLLVGTGKLAVPGHICCQNCGQLSGLRHCSTLAGR